MFRLERNAWNAADAFSEHGSADLLPTPKIKESELNISALSIFLKSAFQTEFLDTLALNVSNETLLRSLIGWAIYEWVLRDPFPVFGTEDGPLWEEMKRMLEERGKYILAILLQATN
jgi:hypothetical protein